MNVSGLGGSMLRQRDKDPNASFNSSFSSSGMSFSRRGGRGENTVIMSNAMSMSVEPYGVPLPAMVKVALSSASSGDTHQQSCRLDPNGWGWLVSGRKLYVWKHSQEIGKKCTIACRELVLPPSELVHNAQLVSVLVSGSTLPPSCLAVSPEGHITYWPNIANESSTVSLNADIPGQECDSVTSLWPTGCILTTTSSTVLLIKPTPGRGNKPTLTCVPLGTQKGWLGGWSKKVSTMLFTPMPAAPSGLDSKRARVVVPLSKEDDPSRPGNTREGKIYIFQGPLVQTWQINADDHACLGEVNIDEHLRRQFLENVWAAEDNKSDLRGIQSWILDVVAVPSSKQLAVFAAAKSQYESTENLVYGIVIFDLKSMRRREGWQFIAVSCGVRSTVFEDEQLYLWRLLAIPNYYYVISRDAVLTASDKSDIPSDSIESNQLNGPIIGAGLFYGTTVVILVPKPGLLSIRPCPQGQEVLGLDETFSEIRVPDHLALSITQVNLADLSASDDIVNRYKSAFLLFLQKKTDESFKILETLFPPATSSTAPHDPLDLSTVTICEKLIDEAPVSDPRWAASFDRADDPDPLGMKSKILIKNFLMDKKEGLELFFGFLNSTGIWPRLEGVIIKEDAVATGSLLYNCYEKVYFALSLQNMQSEPHFRKAIDTAIKSLVMIRKSKEVQVRSSHVSPIDFFYKEVSRVHQIIPALISIQEDDFNQLPVSEIPARIIQTNEIILRAILEVTSMQPADKLSQIYDFLIKPLMTSTANQYEVLPWIVQSSILRMLIKQQEIIVKNGVNNPEVDVGIKIDLLKQLQQYTDLILDGLKTNVESISNSQRYEQKFAKFETTRAKLLRTHLEVGDYDGACLLAEKYMDFEILVKICYDTKNRKRLELFFDKYANIGFPEFTFEWYVKQKKTAELIDDFSKSKFQSQLGKFLERYPQIAWHHSAVTENFEGAAEILKGLSDAEEVYVEDKKFMLCMAKLAALASESPMAETKKIETPFVEDIDKSLRLIQFQSRLSNEILNAFGLDRKTMRVLSATEMIDMYTTPDVDFEPENYTNALGLAEYMMNEHLRSEKRLLIVARAVKRDPWDKCETDHPMDVIFSSDLYRYLTLALQQGVKLDEVYPINQLNDFSELQSLLQSPNAKFLLEACHEYLSTRDSEEMES